VRVVSSLLEPIEVRTAQGGLAVSYEPMGSVWLKLGARRRREKTELGLGRSVEVMTAEARADERLAEGFVLRFGGADWGLEGIGPVIGGRVKLELERRR
jgi:hypothetical protein